MCLDNAGTGRFVLFRDPDSRFERSCSSRYQKHKFLYPQITGQYGSDLVATIHCTLGTRHDFPSSAGNKALDIPRT